MKLSVGADNPLEWLALASGRVPTPLMDGWWGVALARSLLAGRKPR